MLLMAATMSQATDEKHLMELDTPERVADEAFAFIDQAHKDYK